jgi:hypothetical protein
VVARSTLDLAGDWPSDHFRWPLALQNREPPSTGQDLWSQSPVAYAPPGINVPSVGLSQPSRQTRTQVVVARGMATPAKGRARRVVGLKLIGRLGAWADLRGDLSASRWRSTPVAAIAFDLQVDEMMGAIGRPSGCSFSGATEVDIALPLVKPTRRNCKQRRRVRRARKSPNS